MSENITEIGKSTFNVWVLGSLNEYFYRYFKSWFLFVFLSLLIFDRILTLIHFGFVYTDIDQTVLWNGALDYSRGVFHEPYFYGQAYNYMLESFLAVPLLWFNTPVYLALPIVTTVLALLPFVALALFFRKRGLYFWTYLSLGLPVLLPIEYNFLTTISRGFVQAHLFVPLLFIPLFHPEKPANVTLLYISSALCFIANQSSAMLILPVFLLVYTYHARSGSFYLKAFWVVPILAIDYWAKHFYKIHPEKVLHHMSGITIDIGTFIESIKNASMFDNLFPIFSGWGIVYPFLFLLLLGIAFVKSMKREFLFIFIILSILFVSLSVPRIHTPYPNAGLFYTSGRLYLYLPLLLIISSYLVLKKLKQDAILVFLLIVLSLVNIISKNWDLQKTAESTIAETVFPVAKNQELVARAKALKQIAEKNNIDLIVHANDGRWDYVFDSYAFNPLTYNNPGKGKKIISVNQTGDRRSMLYPDSEKCENILLNGIKVDTFLMDTFDNKMMGQELTIIKNSEINTSGLFNTLKLKYGNPPY